MSATARDAVGLRCRNRDAAAPAACPFLLAPGCFARLSVHVSSRSVIIYQVVCVIYTRAHTFYYLVVSDER